MIKKLAYVGLAGISLAMVSTTAMAAQNTAVPLDKIAFTLSVQQWATTKTARVIVGVNATLNDAELGRIHGQIMANLARIVPGASWHITQFSRSKSNSGLEQLAVEAQARVSSVALANLRQKAKAATKPGENYQILAIQFNPSQSEIEQTRVMLREKIYKKAQQELVTLNKLYPVEKYYLHTVSFRATLPMVRPQMMLARVAPAAAEQMAVSNKVTVTANVVLASNYHVQYVLKNPA